MCQSAIPSTEQPDKRCEWRLVVAFPEELDAATVSELLALSRRQIDFELERTRIIGLGVPSSGSSSSAARYTCDVTFDPCRLPFDVVRTNPATLRALGLGADDAGEVTRGRATWLIDGQRRVRASLRYPYQSARSIDELLRLTMALRNAEACGSATPEGWKPGDDDVWPYAALRELAWAG